MLRAAPPGHPLQKPTVVQWDIGAMLSADGAADESVSPQSGISSITNRTHQADQYLSGRDPNLIHVRIQSSNWISGRVAVIVSTTSAPPTSNSRSTVKATAQVGTERSF